MVAKKKDDYFTIAASEFDKRALVKEEKKIWQNWLNADCGSLSRYPVDKIVSFKNDCVKEKKMTYESISEITEFDASHENASLSMEQESGYYDEHYTHLYLEGYRWLEPEELAVRQRILELVDEKNKEAQVKTRELKKIAKAAEIERAKALLKKEGILE